MGQKDLRLKKLFSHNDIFADVLNALLFNGEQVVKPEELIDAGTDSQYEGDELAHGQEQDCAKYWVRNGRIIAKFCLEHQIKVLWYMPVRGFGYEGASYREEFNDDDIEQLKRTAADPGYAVISLVLYYGTDRWEYSRSLSEVMKVPEFLLPYANDYRMNLFEISWLIPEQVKKFRSDLRVMTDYLVQRRMTDNFTREPYHPSDIRIVHKHDFFEAMNALTDREWLTEEVKDMIRKGEEITMISAYAEVEKRGYDRGVEYGKSQMKSACAEVEKRGYDRGVEYGKAQMKSAYAEVEKKGYDRGEGNGIRKTERRNALNMLKDNKLSMEDISRYSGLSISEVKNLRKSIKE